MRVSSLCVRVHRTPPPTTHPQPNPLSITQARRRSPPRARPGRPSRCTRTCTRCCSTRWSTARPRPTTGRKSPSSGGTSSRYSGLCWAFGVCVLMCAGGEGVSLWFCGFVCARSTVHRPSPNTHTHPFHTLNLTPQTAGLLLPSRHRPRGPRPRRGHPSAHRRRLHQRGGRRRRCRGARGGAGPVLAGGGGELPGVADAVRVIFVVVDGYMGVCLSLRSSGGPALSARDRPGDSTANHQLSTRNAPQLNQTSYVMMRLHHLLYERLQTAREICEQARDAKGASAAHPLKVSVFECLFVGLVRPPFRRRPSATTDPARNHLHSHLNFRGTDVCTHTYTRKRE